MGGLSIWHWIIVLVVVLLVFGTKRLRNAGRDLGEAVKGFKDGMREPEKPGGRLGDERTEGSRPGAQSGRDRAQRWFRVGVRGCSISVSASCCWSQWSPGACWAPSGCRRRRVSPGCGCAAPAPSG